MPGHLYPLSSNAPLLPNIRWWGYICQYPQRTPESYWRPVCRRAF